MWSTRWFPTKTSERFLRQVCRRVTSQVTLEAEAPPTSGATEGLLIFVGSHVVTQGGLGFEALSAGLA